MENVSSKKTERQNFAVRFAFVAAGTERMMTTVLSLSLVGVAVAHVDIETNL